MKEIEFKNKSTNEIYLDYIRRVERMTKTLSEKDRQDILMELNSHIYEHMQQNTITDEVENMLAILKRLGAPEDTLVSLIADKKLSQATKTFNPLHIIKALSLNISNGFVYILFSLSYLFLFIFIFLVFAKLLYPDNTGLFIGENKINFGFISNLTANSFTEVLGNWYIPVILLAGMIIYLFITILLKLKYRLKHKKQ